MLLKTKIRREEKQQQKTKNVKDFKLVKRLAELSLKRNSDLFGIKAEAHPRLEQTSELDSFATVVNG